MIKTKFDNWTVKVNDRELQIGDKVLLENKKDYETIGHMKIYEVIGIKEAIPNACSAYYELKREDETSFEVEARWFDCDKNKTYLVEE
jgi:hypothetical protein